MGLESTDVEMPTVNRAKATGWTVYKVSWLGQRGAPDRCFMGHGVCVWIEFKRPGKEPTVQQFRMIDRMRAAGLNVEWFDNADAAAECLACYAAGARRRCP